MKLSASLLALALFLTLVSFAHAAEALPGDMAKPLNKAAATGNPLVLTAVSDHLSRLNPLYRESIAEYVVHVANPATEIAAIVAQMIQWPPQVAGMEGDVFNLQTAAGPDDLATKLNAINVGPQ